MDKLVGSYAELGVAGFLIVVAAVILIWWLKTGRKQSEAIKTRLAEQLAINSKVIENNTAAVNNCTEVIKANTQQRQEDARYLCEYGQSCHKHGEQLDTLIMNQKVCMALQDKK